MKKLILMAIVFATLSVSAQKKDSTHRIDNTLLDSTEYYITGTINQFQVLYTAVTSPGDVTPNQVKALDAWIKTLKVIPNDKKSKK